MTSESERELQDVQDGENLRSGDPTVVLETIRRVASSGIREEYELQNDRVRAQAIAAQALYQFFRDNPRLAIQANENLIRSWCADKHAAIKADSIALAVDALGSQLAMIPLPPVPPPPTPQELAATENERLQNSSPSSLHREIRKHDQRWAATPTITIPYTAKELLAMPSRVLRNLISYPDGSDRPGYRKAVNDILAAHSAQRNR